MRTNLNLDAVAELIDQAIVWLNFASARAEDTAVKMERLRASDLGSATEIADFVGQLKGTVPHGATADEIAQATERQREADALLTITAGILRLDDCVPPTVYDRAQLRRIFTSIALDDGTQFLVKLKALSPH
jgi:hypothetical protein